MKKTLIWMLIAAMLLPCALSGCNTASPISEGTALQNAADEGAAPVANAQNIPSEDSMKLTNVTIISNGTDPAEATAAAELQKYLEQRNVTVGEGGFPITLVLDETIGDDSFRITSSIKEGAEDIGMTIAGGNGRGVLYGVYNFLQEFAGFRAYTPDLEVFLWDDIVIGDGVILEYTPTFEMRMNDWYRYYYEPIENDHSEREPYWYVKNGLNIAHGNWRSWNESLGSSWDYGGLFVHTIGKLTGHTGANPCLCDETVYEKALASVRQILADNPSTTIISVSQNDTTSRCTCANCKAVDAEEGSPAGLWVRFVNRIAVELEDEYPNVVIDTLAYQHTQAAPKITVPHKNVCIRLCSFKCHFTHPLTDATCSANATFVKDMNDWSKICDRIYVWDYVTNYRYYIATYATLDVLRENMQFFAEHNVKGMYPQGNYQSISGEFGELRAYLIAKLMWDPFMTEEEYYAHMDEFLKAYYGEGWQYIRMYIDKTCEMYEDSCNNLNQSPLSYAPKEQWLDMEEAFDEWWDRAEALAGDRAEAVFRSRFQWRYVQALLHPDQVEIRDALIADVSKYDMNWQESIKDANRHWGIK